MEDKKYSISEFIYWLEKYNDIDDIKWTKGEIASLIAKAMIDFFPDTDGAY